MVESIADSEVSSCLQDDTSSCDISSNDTDSECLNDDTCSECFEDDTEDEIGKTEQDNEESDNQANSSRLELVRSIAVGMFSSLLLAFFVLSAAITNESAGGVSWILFFTLNAALPLIFLIQWSCCFPIWAINILAMINGVWSIVFLIMAALQGRDMGSHASIMTDLNIRDTTSGVLMRQNSIIAMASIGFFSSMYHSLMAEHFLDAKKTGRNTGSEIEIPMGNEEGSIRVYSVGEKTRKRDKRRKRRKRRKK